MNLTMNRFKNTLALIALAAAGAASASTPTLDQAHLAYFEGQYSRSLQMYEQLAASGNAEAAERAGFMLFHGGVYYGAQVSRDPARAAVLLAQAAHAGRTGASFMLNLIDLSN
jgi:TPR repeat protein